MRAWERADPETQGEAWAWRRRMIKDWAHHDRRYGWRLAWKVLRAWVSGWLKGLPLDELERLRPLARRYGWIRVWDYHQHVIPDNRKDWNQKWFTEVGAGARREADKHCRRHPARAFAFTPYTEPRSYVGMVIQPPDPITVERVQKSLEQRRAFPAPIQENNLL